MKAWEFVSSVSPVSFLIDEDASESDVEGRWSRTWKVNAAKDRLREADQSKLG